MNVNVMCARVVVCSCGDIKEEIVTVRDQSYYIIDTVDHLACACIM